MIRARFERFEPARGPREDRWADRLGSFERRHTGRAFEKPSGPRASTVATASDSRRRWRSGAPPRSGRSRRSKAVPRATAGLLAPRRCLLGSRRDDSGPSSSAPSPRTSPTWPATRSDVRTWGSPCQGVFHLEGPSERVSRAEARWLHQDGWSRAPTARAPERLEGRFCTCDR